MSEAFDRDRRSAEQWARDLLAQTDFVILDTETTGLDNDAEIVQIAVIDHAGQVLLNTLVKPTYPIPPGATRIHGITDEQVKDAPTFVEIAAQVSTLLSGKRIVIYNAEYDARLLRQTAKAAGLSPSWAVLTADCAMLAYSQWIGDWSDYHGNYRFQRLPGGDHSALGDARATLAVIRRMAANEATEGATGE